MNNHMDKSLFFLTISFVCIWIVVDVAVGKNRLGAFLSTIFPFMGGEGDTITPEQNAEDTANAEKKTENAPDSAAISGNKNKYSVPGTTGPLDSIQSGTGINTVPYGATRPGVN